MNHNNFSWFPYNYFLSSFTNNSLIRNLNIFLHIIVVNDRDVKCESEQQDEMAQKFSSKKTRQNSALCWKLLYFIHYENEKSLNFSLLSFVLKCLFLIKIFYDFQRFFLLFLSIWKIYHFIFSFPLQIMKKRSERVLMWRRWRRLGWLSGLTSFSQSSINTHATC